MHIKEMQLLFSPTKTNLFDWFFIRDKKSAFLFHIFYNPREVSISISDPYIYIRLIVVNIYIIIYPTLLTKF